MRKVFYKDVLVKKNDSGTLYNVFLDNKPVKSPNGLQLSAPSPQVAHVIAAEWLSQNTYIRPYTMHFTSLAFTAMEKHSLKKEQRIEEILGFLESDTLW